jgi:hypothetical protein
MEIEAKFFEKNTLGKVTKTVVQKELETQNDQGPESHDDFTREIEQMTKHYYREAGKTYSNYFRTDLTKRRIMLENLQRKRVLQSMAVKERIKQHRPLTIRQLNQSLDTAERDLSWNQRQPVVDFELERTSMNLKIDMFSRLNYYFERVFNQEKGAGSHKQEKIDNLNNVLKAEIQQFVAMAMVVDPQGQSKELQKYRQICTDVYGLEAKHFEGFKRGVYGLVGAYYKYAALGYKVIFPPPEVDANQETDLFLIRYQDAPRDIQRLLDDVDYNNINKADKRLKLYIVKTQVKCHANLERGTREFKYDYRNGSVEMEKADFGGVIDKKQLSAYNNTNTDEYWFFKNQCQQYGFSGTFIDFSEGEVEKKYLQKK